MRLPKRAVSTCAGRVFLCERYGSLETHYMASSIGGVSCMS